MDPEDHLAHLDHKEKEVRLVYKESQDSRAHKVLLDYQEKTDVSVTQDEQDLLENQE